MSAMALSFAWECWRRHRVVTTLIGAYLLVLALLVHAVPAGTLDPRIVVQLTIPLWFAVPFLIAVLSHGDHADVLARESAYPRRAFTLPLRNTALVGWPMALGGVVVAAFWLVLGGLVLRGVGQPVPVGWVAVFLAALLAWVQALTWTPFPLTVLRVLVAVPVLSGLIAAAILGQVYAVSPALLLAAFVALIPPGYLLAVAGVARARRGDVPVRSWPILQWFGRTGAPRPPFRSAAAALAWLDWRGNFLLLPLLVGLVVVPQIQLVCFVDNSRATLFLLLGLAIYPLMMAATAGTSLGSVHAWMRQDPAIPPFLAARPVTSAALITVKLRGTLLATLLTWVLIVVAVLVVLPFPHVRAALVRGLDCLFETQGAAKGWACLLLLGAGAPALTWKLAVDQLWLGLSGRYWITVFAGVTIAVVIGAAGLIGSWTAVNPNVQHALWAAAPWAAGVLLLLKVGLGALVAWGLRRRGLVTRRTLAGYAAAWLAGAAALLGLACWLVPPDVDSPLLAGCGAVLIALPLVRLGLAPLALDWNRHR